MRLVACDLDGTLLRSDGTLSARTRTAWNSAAAAGLEMVIVTARPPRYLNAVASALGCGGFAICANGAITYDLATRQVVEVRPMSREATEKVVTAIVETLPGVGFAVETGRIVVHEPGFIKPFQGDVRHAARDLADMWRRGTPIVKLLAWSAVSTADSLLTVVQAAAGSAAECTHSGGQGLVEVSAAGVSKVSALASLCLEKGIAACEVVAFGDMPNDLAMLEWAGAGYAVANAHPAVLAAGLGVTAANDEDGVAMELERLLST